MRELRIGLVLYGGVSLAVYMNGIVTELWHGLRASQRLRQRSQADPEAEPLGGTAAVYLDLLRELDRGEGTEPIRIVVDAVAGTSAGGVNGGVLAKAIVDGGNAAVLNRVWVEEADISELKGEPDRSPRWLRFADWALGHFGIVARLHDRVAKLPGISWEWARDTVYTLFTSKDSTRTPLKGGHFSYMIAKTYRDMGSGPPLLPRRGTFDLYLTRTDLDGWPRHLPVSRAMHPDALYERAHAHIMAFRRDPSGSVLNDDFGLTFATRSTASFPAAFAPISYTDIAEAYASARTGEPCPKIDAFARRHLREHTLADLPPEAAWMVDGGLLDNKPFTHVAAAIEEKAADHEVYRMLVYIEPDPVGSIAPEQDGPAVDGRAAPGALRVLQRVYGLLRYEPIFADLQALQARNAKVERLRDVRDANMASAVAAAEAVGAREGLTWRAEDIGRWREVTNAAAARDRQSGYAGYVVLKARRAAAVAARAICEALQYPYHSRHAFFVRYLVRAWLGRRGALAAPEFVEGEGFRLSPAQAELLGAFDVPFRLRRVRALVQRVNGAYEGSEDRAALDTCKERLADIAFGYGAPLRDLDDIRSRITEALAIGTSEIDGFIAQMASDPDGTIAAYDDRLAAVYDALCAKFTQAGSEQNAQIENALAALPPAAFEHVAKGLAAFPFLDPTLFPVMDAAEVSDLIVVEAMRISPDDGSLLAPGRPKLLSRELGAFAGFLDRHAREHDLMWGRLDGAERLIQLILTASARTGADPERLRALGTRFTKRAMLAILDEEAGRTGKELTGLIETLRARLNSG